MSVHDTLATTIDTLPEDHPVRLAYLATSLAPATGTARAWFEAHNGQIVTTVQVSETMGVWAPTGRQIEATRAGSVQLNGSTRDYKGLRVLHTEDDALICQTGGTVILYVIETS